MPKTFKEQNSELFAHLLNTLYEYNKVDSTQENYSIPVMELYLTPTCNQQCEYCYLQKNKEHLYPSSLDDKATILKNLRILFDYYLEKGYSFKRIDLFSGEIQGYPYGNEVFDILLEYIQKGVKIDFISIPTNASFCFSSDLTNIVNQYIYKFSRLGTRVSYSISYDGPYLDAISRPNSQNIDKNEEYLKNLTTFMKQNLCGFHPMIAPATIEYQIENYKSWLKLFDDYFPEEEPLVNYGRIMQLETREVGWTEPKIIEYLKWLKFMMNADLEYFFHGNIEAFLKKNAELQSLPDAIAPQILPTKDLWEGYMPYRSGPSADLLGCVLGKAICVRLGDLALAPCHRTSYPKFMLGNFVLNEDKTKIIDIECNNYPLASAIYVTGFLTKPVCSTCALNDCCPKYCLGANYEYSHELFYPVEDNCNLQKAKIVFLYHYYNKLGAANAWVVNRSYAALKEKEPEVEKKWSSIVQSLI